MKISKSFYIRVDENGAQTPQMLIYPEKFSMLTHLANGHLSRSKGVSQELVEIEKVLNGKSAKFSFAGDDWCIVTVAKNESTISNGFDEFDPISISTIDLFELLSDWYKFLLKYENGEIPGLSNPSI